VRDFATRRNFASGPRSNACFAQAPTQQQNTARRLFAHRGLPVAASGFARQSRPFALSVTGIPRITMKSLLSHHEIAILLLLLNAPGQVSRSDPDALALARANLIEIVSEASVDSGFRLTSEGTELLRRLGIKPA
jgi:hypothetical protein